MNNDVQSKPVKTTPSDTYGGRTGPRTPSIIRQVLFTGKHTQLKES
jgi:hypothetical protein